MSAKEHNQHHS